MEIPPNPQEMETQQSPTNSQKNTAATHETIYNNGSPRNQTPPHTPKIISRSESAFQPSTFVQADTTTFKQVVQMLTGSSETAKKATSSATKASDPPPSPTTTTTTRNSIPPIKTGQKKQGFKLYERRNSIKNNLMISPLNPDGFNQNFSFSPRRPEILSPSILDFPSLALSPKTPLNEDSFINKSPPSSAGSLSEEEKAIAEKKFYLHPSPRTTTPRGSSDHPPPLLSLFPVTSPRLSGPSS